MPARKRRTAYHTVLVVGEGTTECAFLRHIKTLYNSRGCGVSVTIRNAHGKGPDHVVDYAIRQCRNAEYDRIFRSASSTHPTLRPAITSFRVDKA